MYILDNKQKIGWNSTAVNIRYDIDLVKTLIEFANVSKNF